MIKMYAKLPFSMMHNTPFEHKLKNGKEDFLKVHELLFFCCYCIVNIKCVFMFFGIILLYFEAWITIHLKALENASNFKLGRKRIIYKCFFLKKHEQNEIPHSFFLLPLFLPSVVNVSFSQLSEILVTTQNSSSHCSVHVWWIILSCKLFFRRAIPTIVSLWNLIHITSHWQEVQRRCKNISP